MKQEGITKWFYDGSHFDLTSHVRPSAPFLPQPNVNSVEDRDKR